MCGEGEGPTAKFPMVFGSCAIVVLIKVAFLKQECDK